MNFKKSLKSVATFVLGAGMALNSMFAAPRITAGIPEEFYNKLCADYQKEPLLLSAILLAIYMAKNPDEYQKSIKALENEIQAEDQLYEQEQAGVLAEALKETTAEILERLKTPLKQTLDSTAQLSQTLKDRKDPATHLQNCLDVTTTLESDLWMARHTLADRISGVRRGNVKPHSWALDRVHTIHRLRNDLLRAQKNLALHLSYHEFQGWTEHLEGAAAVLHALKKEQILEKPELKAYHVYLVRAILKALPASDDTKRYQEQLTNYIQRYYGKLKTECGREITEDFTVDCAGKHYDKLKARHSRTNEDALTNELQDLLKNSIDKSENAQDQTGEN